MRRNDYLVLLMAIFFPNMMVVMAKSSSVAPLVNYQVRQLYFVTSAILRREVNIVVGLSDTEEVVDKYRLIVPPEEAPYLAYYEAAEVQDQATRLDITEPAEDGQLPCQPAGARCLDINLTEPLSASRPKTNVVVALVLTHQYEASPARNEQKASLVMKMAGSSYFYSPYMTLEQKVDIEITKEFGIKDIFCPSPNDLNPTPSRMEGHVVMTCGPYQNVDRLTYDKDSLVVSLRIAKIPFVTILTMERTITIDPLWNKLHVSDIMDVRHDGFEVEGGFSRIELMKQLATQQTTNQVMSFFPMAISKHAENIKVTDEVGRLTGKMGVRRAAQGDETTNFLDFQLRNPLSGGWSFAWKVEYDIPLSKLVSELYIPQYGVDATRLEFPYHDLVYDVSIDRLRVNVVVPAGTEVYGGHILVALNENKMQRTQGSISLPFRLGRQTVYQLDIENVVRTGGKSTFVLLYSMSAFAKYYPVVVGLIWTALVGYGLYLLARATIRQSASTNISTNESPLRQLFSRRRQLAQALLDQLTSSPGSMKVDSASISELRSIEGDINVLLKENLGRTSAGLSSLYRQQMELLRPARNSQAASALVNSLLELDQNILQTESTLLA